MNLETLDTLSTPSSGTPSPLHGLCALSEWGVIRAWGEDAASFLHGQLTSDFALLGFDEARLAAFCNAKGRMQASFVALKISDQEVLLCCPLDVLAPTLKRLSMFVLRAKAKLSDATADYALYGAVGDAIPSTLPAPIWSKHTNVDADLASHWVRLHPANGHPRALVCLARHATPLTATLTLAHWQWLEALSGVCLVTLPVFEAFVPQMLNYESVGGVNFKKGCYPGQEVVARSQFRGTLKRRAMVVTCSQPVTVGQSVFHAADAEQPCGMVAAAGPNPAGGFHALVSMQLSALDGQALTANSAQGPLLHVLPLPYDLLEDL